MLEVTDAGAENIGQIRVLAKRHSDSSDDWTASLLPQGKVQKPQKPSAGWLL